MGLGPAAERRRGAGLVHHRDERAEEDEEEEDAHVVRVGHRADEAILGDVDERPLEGEAGVEDAAGDDADEERGVDLLGQEREDDREDWREDRPPGAVEGDAALLVGPDRRERRRLVGLEVRVVADVVGVGVDVRLGALHVAVVGKRGEVVGVGRFVDDDRHGAGTVGESAEHERGRGRKREK